ncbi:hypothetical protein Q1695_010162 [Nippostrongylus brasiliensis]|nr:hypothetical protein Q1695_010162 [Nippostrongylus brasiliensis]
MGKSKDEVRIEDESNSSPRCAGTDLSVEELIDGADGPGGGVRVLTENADGSGQQYEQHRRHDHHCFGVNGATNEPSSLSGAMVDEGVAPYTGRGSAYPGGGTTVVDDNAANSSENLHDKDMDKDWKTH